ncbi:phosphoesterase RecJ domain-containing protein [Chryseolinea serpens]|uniref:Phosphoesterase RecJ domain-containing protein n=1 Tax=Chryseolinea serpens TaxID=947013 RepID=A0A1M5WCR3_9BACT|nr:bifunctional oligoribonuclease/PAP phosphatase NrnA [Chryseolinea serpens]SHH85305.1 phosphoesterase RecJ domain-containing protein [Chryseolinea serpens]
MPLAFEKPMQNIKAFKDQLSQPRKVVILTHFKPDADALGSSLGLARYLKKKGHAVTVITPSDYPDFIAWMPGNEEVVIFQKDKPDRCAKLVADAEMIFCLDFSSLNRINEMGGMVREAGAKKVLVDHHLEPEHFADFEQWDGTAASTAELVYQLIVELDDQALVDGPMADCLYAGIMTDTGGFRHSNTNHKVFQIASDLVARGANPYKVSKLIYETNSLERLRLMGYVLWEKLQVLPEYKTAYIALTADELKRFGSQTGDTEGLVNFGLSIKGIKLSVIISDRRENIKLSLRSLGDFSVNEMARAHFQGGGHRNAAGGQTNLTLEQTVKKFLDLLPQYKDQLLAD